MLISWALLLFQARTWDTKLDTTQHYQLSVSLNLNNRILTNRGSGFWVFVGLGFAAQTPTDKPKSPNGVQDS